MSVEAEDPATEPAGRRDLNPLWVVALAVALGLVVLLLVVWKPASKAPYSVGAVSPTASVEIVKPDRAQHELDRLAGTGRLTAALIPGTDQVVVGQLSFDTPSKAPHDGQYALFVIDNDDHRPVPAMWGVGPKGSNVGQGWDSRYAKLATKYDWLKPLTESGASVSFPPDTRSPVTFEAVPRRGSLPITDPADQLTVALVFLDANGDVYWATQLPL